MIDEIVCQFIRNNSRQGNSLMTWHEKCLATDESKLGAFLWAILQASRVGEVCLQYPRVRHPLVLERHGQDQNSNGAVMRKTNRLIGFFIAFLSFFLLLIALTLLAISFIDRTGEPGTRTYPQKVSTSKFAVYAFKFLCLFEL